MSTKTQLVNQGKQTIQSIKQQLSSLESIFDKFIRREDKFNRHPFGDSVPHESRKVSTERWSGGYKKRKKRYSLKKKKRKTKRVRKKKQKTKKR